MSLLFPAYRLSAPVAIDVYGGARYMMIDVSSEFNDVETISGDKGWVDPIIGLHMSLPFAEKFAYRWLDVDYDKDDFALDALISGPMLGVFFYW